MSRQAGKKSERSKAQSKALEEMKVDPSVTRLQVTLGENLDFFMNNIGGMIRDLNAKLDGTRTACEKAHAQMKVSLTTALLEREQQVAGGMSNPGSPNGTVLQQGGGFPVGTVASGTVTPVPPVGIVGDSDAEAIAAAAAIAAKVREADERRKAHLEQQAEAKQQQPAAAVAASGGDATAPPAGSPKADVKKDAAADAAATPAPDAANAGAAKTEDGKTATTKKAVATIKVAFPDNGLLVGQLQVLKKEAYALGTTFDGIHDWIALNLPDYREEDNMGVEVMGACIQQTTALQEVVRDVYSAELKYLDDRAELEKNMLKLPDSDTVRRQLELLDLDAWDSMERGWRSMIRVSLILFSTLKKNMKLLKEPRKSRTSTLFM